MLIQKKPNSQRKNIILFKFLNIFKCPEIHNLMMNMTTMILRYLSQNKQVKKKAKSFAERHFRRLRISKSKN